MKKCLGCKIAIFLVALGSMNYLMLGAGVNMITLMSGGSLLAMKLWYILIAFAGLILAIGLLRSCPGCKKCNA